MISLTGGPLLSEMRQIRKLLEAEQASVGGDTRDVDVTDWLLPDVDRRVISDRRSLGSDNLVIPSGTTTATVICQATPGRAAGSIVNAGANPCYIYLAAPGRVIYQQGGVAAGYLVTNGSWDFKWSDRIWSGWVSAISPLGCTLVWGQL